MVRCPVTNNIRTLRFHHNKMTQQELAFRIADLFDVPLEELFQFDPENSN